jgi:hypothetical protein
MNGGLKLDANQASSNEIKQARQRIKVLQQHGM